MKITLIGLILVLSSIASSANAAWCRAESPQAWGYAEAYTIASACNQALAQCASRTSPYYTCVVVGSAY